MPFGIGMFLGLSLSFLIVIGGLIAYFVKKKKPSLVYPGIIIAGAVLAGEGLGGFLMGFFTTMNFPLIYLIIPSSIIIHIVQCLAHTSPDKPSRPERHIQAPTVFGRPILLYPQSKFTVKLSLFQVLTRMKSNRSVPGGGRLEGSWDFWMRISAVNNTVSVSDRYGQSTHGRRSESFERLFLGCMLRRFFCQIFQTSGADSMLPCLWDSSLKRWTSDN